MAWYADGDTIVRSEYNPSVAYAYGKLYARNDRLQGFRLIFAAFFFFFNCRSSNLLRCFSAKNHEIQISLSRNFRTFFFSQNMKLYLIEISSLSRKQYILLSDIGEKMSVYVSGKV